VWCSGNCRCWPWCLTCWCCPSIRARRPRTHPLLTTTVHSRSSLDRGCRRWLQILINLAFPCIRYALSHAFFRRSLRDYPNLGKRANCVPACSSRPMKLEFVSQLEPDDGRAAHALVVQPAHRCDARLPVQREFFHPPPCWFAFERTSGLAWMCSLCADTHAWLLEPPMQLLAVSASATPHREPLSSHCVVCFRFLQVLHTLFLQCTFPFVNTVLIYVLSLVADSVGTSPRVFASLSAPRALVHRLESAAAVPPFHLLLPCVSWCECRRGVSLSLAQGQGGRLTSSVLAGCCLLQRLLDCVLSAD
jgi:hypothetical protein